MFVWASSSIIFFAVEVEIPPCRAISDKFTQSLLFSAKFFNKVSNTRILFEDPNTYGMRKFLLAEFTGIFSIHLFLGFP
jgi:hypothetical protein